MTHVLRFRIACLAIVVGLVGGAAPAAGDNDARLTADEWRALRDQCLQTVRENTNVDAVVSAYRRGAKIDPRNADLHRAYLDRLLRWGVLHAAYDPAEQLIKLGKADATVWSTAGHGRATHGDFPDALAAYVKAYTLDPKDTSVLHNLGALAGWLALDPDAKEETDDATERAYEALRIPGRWRRLGPFANGYQEAQKLLRNQAGAARELRRPVLNAQAAVAAAERRLQTLRTAAGEKSGSKAELEKKLQALQRQLAAEKNAANRRRLQRQIAQTRNQIKQVDNSLRSGSGRHRPGVNARRAAEDDLQKKKAVLAALIAQRNKVRAATPTGWRWDPPMVDGKPMTVRLSLPGSKLLPGVGDESAAEKLLKQADLYERNGLAAKARALRQQVVESYPATKAAAEAKTMLDKSTR